MTKSPCYNCIDRTAECHSKCELYLNWSKERKTLVEEHIRREAEVTGFLIVSTIKKREIARKRKLRK